MLQSPVGGVIGSDERVCCMLLQLLSLGLEVLPSENGGQSALFLLLANIFPFSSCVITSELFHSLCRV